MMKRNIGISLAALAALTAGSAFAQQGPRKVPMDTDGNGIVTRAEAQAHSAQMFARMDSNRDGKLDAADRTARQAARFDTMDTDKNGQLSRAEFAAARPGPGMREGGPGERPGMERGHGMRKHGGHGDHGRMGRGGRMGGGMMLMRADANNDAALTRAEFDAAFEQRFARMDTDRNGQITAAERDAARDRMRSNRRGGDAAPTPQ